MLPRIAAIAVIVAGALALTVGLIFLCAASQQPSRLWLAVLLLAIGGGLAAWGGFSLRRSRELDPENLSDRIVELARRKGQAELTLAQVVSELAVPDEAASKALDNLSEKGQVVKEYRGDTWYFLFPGLKETKMIRKCSHCGREYSVKDPIYECLTCGGKVELVKI